MLDVIQLHLTVPTTTFALTNVLDNTPHCSWNRKQCDMFSIRSYSVYTGTAFNIDGTNIVFSAPLSTDVVDFVLVLGETVSIGTPSDGTKVDQQMLHLTYLLKRNITKYKCYKLTITKFKYNN